ncbi:NDP-hexose 2,3-dehydratase family protein [Symbioplanes lichenis]|uniref:NDP-hexose 2,3-dehydratase family protein n=1 Tax=Symbioplanes lichenis TaxID=1629072 RepID=UPI0027381D6F|nr:NDP-hexose 2,3-dehydratase family protein [Actinoplanes lichenis]
MTATGGTRVRPALKARHDVALPERVARSAAALAGLPADDALGWLHRRRTDVPFSVDRIPFEELEGWSFAPGTGNLVHRSGRFFTVEGLHVSVGEEPHRSKWHQPIIVQPEIGILGILAREIDGVLHFLMQAKMEPGNPGLVQLSPTVQATYSNYTKVHGGASVRHLEYFTDPSRGRVLLDGLQSEHGSWFHRKRNRNMIVEVRDPVPEHEDFRWFTLGQIHALMRHDHAVNLDARSVLSGLGAPGTPYALHSDTELLSWLAGRRSTTPIRSERVPLSGLRGWRRGRFSIDHEDDRHFRTVAVSVRAGNREVGHWTQPLIEPRGQGTVAFLTRTFEGVPHVLIQARAEGGLLDVEMGPTVQCVPRSYAGVPAAARPLFLDLVTAADPARIRYSALLSEEGGRFLDSVNHYLVLDADESEAPQIPPPGFRWVSRDQLTTLATFSHYLNVQARTLLLCLNAVAGRD